MSTDSKPTAACIARLNKELQQLEHEPPPGISAWPKDGQINVLEAAIQGPVGSVYEGGTFKLEINVPDRYPFEPPKIRFVTPIYHPNIDSGGRICLDTLNMPPKGEWKPAVNLSTVLSTISLLMAEPNPDDGLMADITNEYRTNRSVFDVKARAQTQMHAVDSGNATLQQNSAPAEEASAKNAQGPPGDGGGARAGGLQEAESEESEEDEEELFAIWGNPAAGKAGPESKQQDGGGVNPDVDAVLDSEGEDDDALFRHPITSSPSVASAHKSSPAKGVPLSHKNTSPTARISPSLHKRKSIDAEGKQQPPVQSSSSPAKRTRTST